MRLYFTIIILALPFILMSQGLTQTVRGTVFDADTKLPLIGAQIGVSESTLIGGTTTDLYGAFRLEDLKIGRLDFHISFLGYETKILSNVVVNTGRQTILEIELQESFVTLDKIVIQSASAKGEALNDMSIISSRSISPEETNRYAGGFNDPSRILSNFAGITNTQEGSNDIIVRGNAPKYVQWRLEGAEITNPNHFSDQSAVGGAVSTLNNNLMATSDFHTGAFTAEYGDALSGVYDVRLRNGNNEKLESVLGLGLLGTEVTLEGPFRKERGGSFLVNYRYSTAGLVSDLGLLGDIAGIPKFQDASFKLLLPTEKFGIFSIFGLGGISELLFEDVTPALWELPGDAFMIPGIQEDFAKKSHLLNTGITHTINLNDKAYLKSILLFSSEGISDKVIESQHSFNLENGSIKIDSLVSKRTNYKGDLSSKTYRVNSTYHHKFNSRNRLEAGAKLGIESLNNVQSALDGLSRKKLVDFNENITTLRSFISWKHSHGENLKFVLGLHNMNVLYNNKSTIEPRFAANYKLNNQGELQFGYGLHSTMESLHHYFAIVPEYSETISPNKNLDLLKSHHFILAYEKRIGKNFRGKIEAYYQHLFNLPIQNQEGSQYATLNEGLEFMYVDLINEGTGRNYGIEMTLERFFANNYYFLLNGSLYESKYTAKDGIERNTQYSGKYLVNLLAGKEFQNLGKKNNQILSLNTKVLFAGGRKIIPLLRNANGTLAVNPEESQFWDYNQSYESSLDDIYDIKLSVSYKWNRPSSTHELYLNLDNLTNTKGRLAEYYDASEPGSIGYVTQFGLFPNLMYRVYL